MCLQKCLSMDCHNNLHEIKWFWFYIWNLEKYEYDNFPKEEINPIIT